MGINFIGGPTERERLAKAGIYISLYEDSVGKKFKSEKHYQWFLANKDTQEFKQKKSLMNKSYYERNGDRLRKDRVIEYHVNNPNARVNDSAGTHIRISMQMFY